MVSLVSGLADLINIQRFTMRMSLIFHFNMSFPLSCLEPVLFTGLKILLSCNAEECDEFCKTFISFSLRGLICFACCYFTFPQEKE